MSAIVLRLGASVVKRTAVIDFTKVVFMTPKRTHNITCRCAYINVTKINTCYSLLKSVTSIKTNHIRNVYTSNRQLSIISFNLTDIGEGIREVSVKEWFVREGDKVEQFDNICEVQSDKASVTITSRYDGIIKKLHYKIDETALVGLPLVDIEVEGEVNDIKEPEKDIKQNEKVENKLTQPEETDTHPQSKKILTIPSVRRISMQHKVDLSKVKATGKDGRVLKEDILRHINMTSDDSNGAIIKEVITNEFIKTEPKLSDAAYDGLSADIEAEKIVPIKGFTKAMVKTMNASLKIPHFVYSDEVDVSQLVVLRNDLKKDAEKAGVSLTYMPFLIKAASLSLAKYPILNSSVDENCENIIYKTSHNIGIAMNTPKGLVVPNVKRVQQKTILEIAAELNALQENGSKGSLTTENLSGGTFSLSNIGIVGGTYAKPVILPPQVSIGAVGKIQVLPRFDKDGAIVRASIMCVSWSADHRIIDGVTMANFSNQWKYYIENPHRFLLDL